MMRLCTPLILMLALYQVDSSDRQKVFGNLHETSSLPCPQSCSGLLTWTMFQRQDDVLVRCTRDSCWSKAGFSLNHDQFLRGDSALTVLRADYSLRGLYRAECDSETLCEVVFTLNHDAVSGPHSRGRRSVHEPCQEGGVPAWAVVLMVLLGAAFVTVSVMYLRLRREHQQPRGEPEGGRPEQIPMNGNPGTH